MATDAKPQSPTPPGAGAFPHRGIRIFTYPKIIFIWPTLVAAIISAIIMAVNADNTADPKKSAREVEANAPAEVKANAEGTKATAEGAKVVRPKRFSSAQNIAGVIFLTVFFVNLIVMSIDFPRFTIIALILAATALILLFLYLNVYFDMLPPLVNLLESLYAVANAGFYMMVATIILINFGVIWVTRYLDFWVIMPNEILHNHGPFSDLERFPTFNLKFDKEIPDILEYFLLGSGRLILHVQNERRAIVLDNVLWIDSKENELKKIMSRLDVRVTSDQEASEPS